MEDPLAQRWHARSPWGLKRFTGPGRSKPLAGVRFNRLPGESADEASYRWLRVWHFVASAVHGVSAVLLLTLYLALDIDEGQSVLYSDTVLERDGSVVANKLLKKYHLFWVLFPMPVVTSLFHVLQGFLVLDDTSDWGRLYRSEIRSGLNVIRWIEYSITASLMTWIVSTLAGMTNVYLLWQLTIVCNVAMQLTGLAHELLQRIDTPYDWVPFATGSIIFLGQWSIIICYFLRSLAAAEDAGTDVPFFVQFIVWGLLASFAGFPIVQILYWGKFKPSAPAREGNAWYWYEFWFIVLSIVSKLLLDWTQFGGIASL